jgi:hypothetical protein
MRATKIQATCAGPGVRTARDAFHVGLLYSRLPAGVSGRTDFGHLEEAGGWKALLRHQLPPDAQRVEAGFQQALSVARHQQAQSMALQATVSLTRLWLARRTADTSRLQHQSQDARDEQGDRPQHIDIQPGPAQQC